MLLVAKWHLGTNLDNLCVLVGAPCWRRLPQLYRNWKIWEFICWSWTSENQAYWHFCVPCHNREWPHMPRPGQGNRFTKPPDHVVARRPVVGRTLAGVAQKAVGEFYLTSAAPERRSSQAVLDKVQVIVGPSNVNLFAPKSKFLNLHFFEICFELTSANQEISYANMLEQTQHPKSRPCKRRHKLTMNVYRIHPSTKTHATLLTRKLKSGISE